MDHSMSLHIKCIMKGLDHKIVSEIFYKRELNEWSAFYYIKIFSDR